MRNMVITMKKTVILLLAVVLLSICARAEKIAEFQDLFKNPNILLDNKQLYIWDKTLLKINVYSRRGFEKVTEFGKKAAGPGEFNFISNVAINDKFIFVSSFPKLCFFSKTGKFQKEIKGPTDAGGFIPFGRNFIGKSYPRTKHTDVMGKILFSLFDSNLKKKRDVFIADSKKFVVFTKKKDIVSWVRDCTKAVQYNDKLIIGVSGKGFYFCVFDLEGKKLYEIEKEYEKRSITEEYKRKRIEEARNRWGEAEWRQYTARMDITFPEYFPAFSNFAVSNGKIYVFKHPKDKELEVVILDLKGNFLKAKRIPFNSALYRLQYGNFSFRFGRMYYLVDNEDTENWELHMMKID